MSERYTRKIVEFSECPNCLDINLAETEVREKRADVITSTVYRVVVCTNCGWGYVTKDGVCVSGNQENLL